MANLQCTEQFAESATISTQHSHVVNLKSFDEGKSFQMLFSRIFCKELSIQAVLEQLFYLGLFIF